MASTDSDILAQLRPMIRLTKASNAVVQILCIAVLPVAEGILASYFASTTGPAKAMAGWMLLLSVLAHFGLGAIVFLRGISSCETVAADALEFRNQRDNLSHELSRKDTAYRLILKAFQKSGMSVCDIRSAGNDETIWAIVRDVLSPVVDNIQAVFSIHRNQFTLEVYLAPYDKYNCSIPDMSLRFFTGRGASEDQARALARTSCSPLRLADQARKTFQKHVDQNEEVFKNGDRCHEGVYFRAYAVCPIYRLCAPGEPPMGYIVLTAQQDESFAEDFREVLEFVSELLSHLLELGQCE